MGPKDSHVLLTLLCIWFVHSHGLLIHEKALSAEEDQELERRLSILNKSPVKTIKMITGDVIDCVDIYKQRAFDHPLLKDHKIQMGDTSSLARFKAGISGNDAGSAGLFPFEGCPEGTIPTRRTTKEDLIREKSLGSLDTLLADSTPVRGFRAGINIVNATSFYVGKATFNIWRPKCTGVQLSASLIRLASGPPNGDSPDESGIYVGWAVYPALYGDDQPRFLTYWKGGESPGCFDLRCPGFVQTDSRFVLGGPFMNISEYGGVQQEVVINIAQDPSTKDWMLIWGTGILVGYWPRNILPGLNDGATRLYFGGLAIGEPSPPMGSSYQPDNIDLKHFGYMRRILFAGALRPFGPPYNNETAGYSESFLCFGLIDLGYSGNDDGYVILFGGPGGSDC